MTTRLFDLHALGTSFDVCGVGNAIVDIIAHSDDAFLDVHGIAKGSMTLVSEERAAFLFDRIGQTVQMSGGSVANTVAGIASLGGTPAFIGKVKDDMLGKIFRHDLRALGVHFLTPPLAEGESTARCLILVTPDAQRSMNTFLGACVDLTPDDIDEKVVGASQVTFLEGYLFDKPAAQEAFAHAAKLVHAADRQLALTLSDTFCVVRHREGFRELVHDHVDILVANEHELMALYQVEEFEEAFGLARKEAKIVAATRSSKGSVIAYGDDVVVVAAEPVAKVIDTTGAGDLYAAGFLYGLTYGCDLATSGQLGSIAAAEVISHIGPRPEHSLRDLVTRKGVRLR